MTPLGVETKMMVRKRVMGVHGHSVSISCNQVLKICLEQIKIFHMFYKGMTVDIHVIIICT